MYIIVATEDDILNKQNALMSKAIRTNGLRLIPGDIQDECEQLVRETKKKADADDPDRAKRRLFDAFGAIGVTVSQIKEYLGHDGETLNPKELEDLRGIYVALKDGETNWREVMDHLAATRKPQPAPQPAAATNDAKPAESSLKDKLRDRAKSTQPASSTPVQTTIATEPEKGSANG